MTYSRVFTALITNNLEKSEIKTAMCLGSFVKSFVYTKENQFHREFFRLLFRTESWRVTLAPTNLFLILLTPTCSSTWPVVTSSDWFKHALQRRTPCRCRLQPNSTLQFKTPNTLANKIFAAEKTASSSIRQLSNKGERKEEDQHRSDGITHKQACRILTQEGERDKIQILFFVQLISSTQLSCILLTKISCYPNACQDSFVCLFQHLCFEWNIYLLF